MSTTELVVEPDFDQMDPGAVGNAIATQGAMQQVRGSYTTAVAVQQPRDLERARKRLMQESTMAGELFYYGWGAGKDKIEGASVKLAMAAARCWGNCAVETLPVQELPDAWIFTSAFVDLETGFTLTRQFRQSKRWMVYGKHDAERKDDIRFQIGQSKAARNVILNALPEWLVDAAVEQAKAGVRKKIEEYVRTNGLPAAVDLLIKSLEKTGVGENLVLAKCEVATRNGLTLDHLVMLRGDLTAIQSGQERAELLFPMPDDNGSKVRRSELNDKPNGNGIKGQTSDPNAPQAWESEARDNFSGETTKPGADAVLATWKAKVPADQHFKLGAWHEEAIERIRESRGPRSNQQQRELGKVRKLAEEL